MKKIVFLKEPLGYNDKTEFIVYLPKVHGKDELLKTLSEILYFPDYFGFNWDALFDCLRDFHWIEKMGVVLVHNELPELDYTSLKTYFKVLIEASEDWKEGEEHYFKVIFPEILKRHIKEIITE
jgi:RNAse (barnase) inhibitor barstar